MSRVQMIGEQIQPEIAIEIAPNGVGVIGFVLRVVVLDQENGRGDTVVVRLAFFHRAGPGEIDIITSLLDLLAALRGYRLRYIRDILVHQFGEQRALPGVQLRRRQTVGLTGESRFA